MLEKYLIHHCSPTLASLKTASIFRCPFTSDEELDEQLKSWNQQFAKKGIVLFLMRKADNMALIYLCRMAHLKADFHKDGVKEFLEQYGYTPDNAVLSIAKLKNRLEVGDSFPHEIGLFLGYPLGDVIGFIENDGKNSKCSGCWKVYCNECETIKEFRKFKKCKDVYCRLWDQGRSVLQLTVAA